MHNYVAKIVGGEGVFYAIISQLCKYLYDMDFYCSSEKLYVSTQNPIHSHKVNIKITIYPFIKTNFVQKIK